MSEESRFKVGQKVMTEYGVGVVQTRLVHTEKLKAYLVMFRREEMNDKGRETWQSMTPRIVFTEPELMEVPDADN